MEFQGRDGAEVVRTMCVMHDLLVAPQRAQQSPPRAQQSPPQTPRWLQSAVYKGVSQHS